MGITAGEIVRSVFAKGCRPAAVVHNHGRIEKKRWRNSVRSYLCGDQEERLSVIGEDEASVRSSTVAEVGFGSFRSNRAVNVSINNSSNLGGGETYSSAGAEVDTASFRSSEATVNQPLDFQESDGNQKAKKQNSAYVLFRQDDAALIIQSAFRAFRAKRAQDGAKMADVLHEGGRSPSRESIGTSIEVQTGNSSDIFSTREESFDLRRTMRQRAKAQVLKIQEDWDDSTVSSVISNMRIRNKMEAATRRERALAYAFSQQLRICSKRKQSATVKGNETNVGWSWLERWMATRQPEIDQMGDNGSCNNVQTVIVHRKMMDASMEEKESCGSNEVSSLFEVGVSTLVPRNIPRPSKTVVRTKTTRSFSRQNSASSHLCPKDSKKVHNLEDEKEKRKRARQQFSGNKKEIRSSTAQVSAENDTEQ